MSDTADSLPTLGLQYHISIRSPRESIGDVVGMERTTPYAICSAVQQAIAASSTSSALAPMGRGGFASPWPNPRPWRSPSRASRPAERLLAVANGVTATRRHERQLGMDLEHAAL